MKINRKLTILFVFHGTEYFNGASKSFFDVVKYLNNQNTYNIISLFPRKEGNMIRELKSINSKIIYGKYDNIMLSKNTNWFINLIKINLIFFRYLLMLFSAKKISKYALQNNVDLIYSNTSSILIGGYISKMTEIPHLWHFREYRLMDHKIFYFFGDKVFLKFANKYSSRIIFISNDMFEKHKLWIDINKARVIYNDISRDYVNPKIIFNLIQNNPLNIFIAGDVKEGKGQLQVVHAIKLLNEAKYVCHLHIAGNTSDKRYLSQIQDYIRINNLDGFIHFHGLVKNMNELRAQMDIGVVASSSEAFGRITIEGMLSMLAMIGRNSAATTELIKDKVNGFLYSNEENNSTNDLVQSIMILYDNRLLMKQLAITGFNYALDTFASEKNAHIIEQQIIEITNN